MKTLLIMRHAKSSWDDPDVADHGRPLNSRGRRDAPAMGQRLVDAGLSPQRILASDATRAVQTAQFVAGSCGYRGILEFLPGLYAAPPAAYLSALAALPDDVDIALVIGHNPATEELVQKLCGGAQAMPTAAIAHLELSISNWSEILRNPAGDLQKVWKVKG